MALVWQMEMVEKYKVTEFIITCKQRWTIIAFKRCPCQLEMEKEKFVTKKCFGMFWEWKISFWSNIQTGFDWRLKLFQLQLRLWWLKFFSLLASGYGIRFQNVEILKLRTNFKWFLKIFWNFILLNFFLLWFTLAFFRKKAKKIRGRDISFLIKRAHSW